MRTPEARSPLELIQEDYRGDPWKISVISIILNVSFRDRCRPIINEFFSRYANHLIVADVPSAEIELLLTPTGLQRKKTERIQTLSRRMRHEWKSVEDLPYLGVYGRDNFSIFVLGELVEEPTDGELKKYVEWAKSWYTSRT